MCSHWNSQRREVKYYCSTVHGHTESELSLGIGTLILIPLERTSSAGRTVGILIENSVQVFIFKRSYFAQIKLRRALVSLLPLRNTFIQMKDISS